MRVRLRKLALVLAAILLLLVVSGAVFVTTPWFKNWLRGVVISQAGAFLNGTIEIGALSGSLFRDVTLTDVTIGMAGAPVIRADSVSARYDVVQLVLGRMSIDELVLTRPAVYLDRTADGWNLASLVRPRESVESVTDSSFVIRKLEIVDGHVLMTSPEAPRREFRGVVFSGALSLGTGRGAVDVGRLHVTDATTGIAARLAAEVTWTPQGVRIAGAKVETTASRLEADVAYEPNPARLDVELEIERLAMRDVAAYMPMELSRDLTLSGRVAAKGPFDRTAARWDLVAGSARTSGELSFAIDASRVPVSGTVRVEDLNLRELTGRQDFVTDVTAAATVDGVLVVAKPEASVFTIELSAPRLAGFGYQATNVRTKGRYEAGMVRADGSLVAYGAATDVSLAGSGLTDVRARRISLTGSLRRLDLQKLPATLGAPNEASDINGRYDVGIDGAVVQANMAFQESRFGATTIEAGSTLSVGLAGKALDAAFDLAMRDVRSELIGRSGEWSGSGSVRGRIALSDRTTPTELDRASGEAVAELEDVRLREAGLGRASLHVSLASGLLTVRRLHVADGLAAIEATGEIAVTDGARQPSNLTMKVGVDDLAALKAIGAPDLRGAVDLSAHITGPARALVATGEVRSYGVAYQDTATALTWDGTFEVSLPDRNLSALTATLTSEGTFVQVRGQEIQRLVTTVRYDQRELDLTGSIEQVDRVLEVDGTLVLLPEAREVRLRSLTLAGAGEPWRLGDTGTATIRYGQDVVSLERVVLRRAAEVIDVSGTVALSPERPASDLRVLVTDVNVGDLYTLIAGASPVSGRASGEVRLGGSVPDPVVDATVTLAEGAIGSVPVRQASAELKLAAGRATVDAAVEPVAGAPLVVRGNVPVAKDRGDLNLRMESSGIGLGLVEGFTTLVGDVTGQAQIGLDILGSLERPVINGVVSIDGGSFRVIPTGVDYRQLDASIRFEGTRASIDRLSLQDSGGHVLQVTGSADVFAGDVARSFEARVRSDEFQVLGNELGDAAVRVDATLEGDVRQPTLRGRVEVTRGRLEVDEILAALAASPAEPTPAPEIPVEPAAAIAQIRSPEPVPDVPEVPAVPPRQNTDTIEGTFFSRAVLDIDLVMPDDVVLRGRDLRIRSSSVGLGNVNMTIGGTIEVDKAANADPVVVGTARVVRGFYDFQGRRFDVERDSAVSFRGETLDPALNITGQREVSGVLVQVRVTGTARRPELGLSSQPPLEEADVLSLIVFNQPLNQLGDAERVDLAERAGLLVAGTLATSLATSLGNALNVDLFEIRAPSRGEAGEVSVGRQLNERLFVGFRQQFGETESTRLTFEYRISEALRLITAIAQGADRTNGASDTETAGADLVYMIRY